MATLNGNRLIGGIRNGDLAVTLVTESPTGDSSDSLQFVVTLDSIEQAEMLAKIAEDVFVREATRLLSDLGR